MTHFHVKRGLEMGTEVHQKGWMHMGWFWRWVMVLLQPLQALRTPQGELALPLGAAGGARGAWGAVGYAEETRARQVGKVIVLVALRHYLPAEGWKRKERRVGGMSATPNLAASPPHPPAAWQPHPLTLFVEVERTVADHHMGGVEHSSPAKEITWGTCPTAHSQG